MLLAGGGMPVTTLNSCKLPAIPKRSWLSAFATFLTKWVRGLPHLTSRLNRSLVWIGCKACGMTTQKLFITRWESGAEILKPSGTMTSGGFLRRMTRIRDAPTIIVTSVIVRYLSIPLVVLEQRSVPIWLGA